VRHALLPSSIAAGIQGSGANWGTVDLRWDKVEELLVVDGYSKGERVHLRPATEWLKSHYSNFVSTTTSSGFWYRADAELHEAGYQARIRSSGLPLDYFRDHVRSMRLPDREGARFVVTTILEGENGPDFAAWAVSREGAMQFPLEIIDEDADLFSPLGGGWPRAELADKLVTVVGIGSIGSAAAEALSGYAVRQFALVDPDRLAYHNFARHRANRRDVGRMKVNAIEEMLAARDPDVHVERYPLDVADDADVMRPLFARSACVLVCSDGVVSRRVANHLACRAGVPFVLACVLEDGGVGEVLRVKPRVTACLLCSREQLREAGVVDPEPSLDRGYGTGFRHLPMTAVGGDLDVIGKLAARVVVSTLLESEGFLAERLPNDHAVVGLRPALDREPEAPFDVERTLEIRWHSLGAPTSDCPSCGRRS
jgi:molybdopterin/thiamine biosynthesis adenylyltransferase